MHHDGYFDAFKLAATKSAHWKTIPSLNLTRAPEAGRAIDFLPIVGGMVDGPRAPTDLQQIRVSCGQTHSWLWKNLVAHGVLCYLTVGDVELGGKREYGTSYGKLKQELRGARRGSDDAYPFHVWLTFPDMHVIDANFYIYRYAERLPQPWRWSEYLICSDHSFATTLELRYVPMLVVDSDFIDGIVD